MIPESHPRYKSLITRESLANFSKTGIVTPEGLTAHGRGELLITAWREHRSALIAEKMQQPFPLAVIRIR